MPDGTMQTFEWKAGDVNHKARGVYHRISAVDPKGVLTLVIMGRRHKHGWGFKVGDEHLDHREYLDIKPTPPGPRPTEPTTTLLILTGAMWIGLSALMVLATLLLITGPSL